MVSWRTLEWWGIAAVFCITGCVQQAATLPQPAGPAAASIDTVPVHGYRWFLIIPPERAYAADRSYGMGGPLATTPEGGEYSHGFVSTYSLSVLDPEAPLGKWRRIGAFQSEEQCTSYKADQLKQISDPAWVSAQARQSPTHLVDAAGTRDLLESGRCISAAQLPAT